MTPAELKAYCLAKAGAWLDEPWEGDEVVKVGDKIFAFLGSPGAPSPVVGLKCGRNSDEAGELRARYPEHVTASAYVGRYGWNTIAVERPPHRRRARRGNCGVRGCLQQLVEHREHSQPGTHDGHRCRR